MSSTSLTGTWRLALTIDETYDYANPFWQHAKYRWTAPDFSDYGEAFDLAQRWLCQQHNVPIGEWRSMLRIKGNLAGRNPVAGSAAERYLYRALLPLAPSPRPSAGRGPRPLRPLRDYAVGLRLALPAPPAVDPRWRLDLDSLMENNTAASMIGTSSCLGPIC